MTTIWKLTISEVKSNVWDTNIYWTTLLRNPKSRITTGYRQKIVMRLFYWLGYVPTSCGKRFSLVGSETWDDEQAVHQFEQIQWNTNFDDVCCYCCYYELWFAALSHIPTMLDQMSGVDCAGARDRGKKSNQLERFILKGLQKYVWFSLIYL